MPRHLISVEHWRWLVALLLRPGVGFSSEADRDRPFIAEVKARHRGLDRSQDTLEFVAGEAVPDRWTQVVILRGVQIVMAAQGYEVLLLGVSKRRSLRCIGTWYRWRYSPFHRTWRSSSLPNSQTTNAMLSRKRGMMESR